MKVKVFPGADTLHSERLVLRTGITDPGYNKHRRKAPGNSARLTLYRKRDQADYSGISGISGADWASFIHELL